MYAACVALVNDFLKAGEGGLICSIYCFLRHKYSHHGQFQATSVTSLSVDLEREVHNGASVNPYEWLLLCAPV